MSLKWRANIWQGAFALSGVVFVVGWCLQCVVWFGGKDLTPLPGICVWCGSAFSVALLVLSPLLLYSREKDGSQGAAVPIDPPLPGPRSRRSLLAK